MEARNKNFWNGGEKKKHEGLPLPCTCCLFVSARSASAVCTSSSSCGFFCPSSRRTSCANQTFHGLIRILWYVATAISKIVRRVKYRTRQPIFVKFTSLFNNPSDGVASPLRTSILHFIQVRSKVRSSLSRLFGWNKLFHAFFWETRISQLWYDRDV